MASLSSSSSFLSDSESSGFSTSGGKSDDSSSANCGDLGHSSPSVIGATGTSSNLPGGAVLLSSFCDGYQYPSSVRLCATMDRDHFSIGGKGAPALTTVSNSFPPMLSTSVRLNVKPVKEVSIYAALIPDVKFDCYYSIKPWVCMYNVKAWEEINAFLPSSGPVVAFDLGLLLSYVVFAFDGKTMKLPHLTASVIGGYKFLHFCASRIVPVSSVIATLVSFDGFVGGSMGGVDPMHMINMAATVGATTIAAADASDAYKKTLNNLTSVATMLTDRQMAIIRKDRPSVKFLNCDSHTGDHALMAAYREIIRSDFKCFVNADSDKERTLVLGSTDREIRCYNHNAFFHFQLANKEAKDTVRLVSDVIKSVREKQTAKLSKSRAGVSQDRTWRYVKQLDKMLEDWVLERKVPERFLLWEETEALFEYGVLHDDEELSRRQEISVFSTFKRALNQVCSAVTGVCRDDTVNFVPFADEDLGPDNYSKCCYDRIIFEDVGYNFSKYDWYKIFRSTNATHAIGYMCLPWELGFSEIIPQEAYRYKIDGAYSCLAYPGYANGYKHKTNRWATFMKNTVIDLKDLTIGVEIVSRAGPMALIRMYRSHGNDNFISCRVLPKDLTTVKLLNIRQSVDHYGKLKLDALVYFRVRREEFEDALNYALDISKDSLCHRNICVYIRRKTMGMSLVTKEMSRVWLVNPGLVGDFAQVVHLCALYRLAQYDTFEKEIKKATFNPFLMLIERTVNRITSPIRSVLRLFMTDYDYQKLLVVDLPDEYWINIDSKCATKRKEFTDVVYAGPNPEGLFPEGYDFSEYNDNDSPDSCTYCMELMECLGSQVIRCRSSAPEDFFHDFTLTETELKTFRTALADTAHDPAGIKAVKEKALTCVPSAAPTHLCRVRYICGPPGTGKSYAIRGMARHDDLVVGPFSRLKEDYTNFTHPVDGRRSSLLFHTQHSAMEAQNHTTVYVDEYTAFPYECLVVIVLRCNANEVVLVGDHRQTGLINGVEGISIGSKIDVDALRSHELVKNYRNPSDAVALLNTKYHYRMLTTNARVGYVYDNDINHFGDYPTHIPLFFKYATAERFGVAGNTSEKVTVRANQGATHDKVKLVVMNADFELFNNPALAIVALSRHRTECVILYEPGGDAEIFVEDLKSCIEYPTLDNSESESEDDGGGGQNGGDSPRGPPPRDVNARRFGRGRVDGHTYIDGRVVYGPLPYDDLANHAVHDDFLTRRLVTFARGMNMNSTWRRLILSVLAHRSVGLNHIRTLRSVFYVYVGFVIVSRVLHSAGVVNIDVVYLVRGLLRYMMPRTLYFFIAALITYINRLLLMVSLYITWFCQPKRDDDDREEDGDHEDGHDWLTKYISDNLIFRQPRVVKERGGGAGRTRYSKVGRNGNSGRSRREFVARMNTGINLDVLDLGRELSHVNQGAEPPKSILNCPSLVVDKGKKVEQQSLSNEKYLVPHKNICLLETIRSYTNESLLQIWRDFVDCCDDSFRDRVINAGISLHDFDKYCVYKTCRYKVIGVDSAPVVCGNEGELIGAIDYSGPVDAGHFKPMSTRKNSDRDGTSKILETATPLASMTVYESSVGKNGVNINDSTAVPVLGDVSCVEQAKLDLTIPTVKPTFVPTCVGSHLLVTDDKADSCKLGVVPMGSLGKPSNNTKRPLIKNKNKLPLKYNTSWCAEIHRNDNMLRLREVELASYGIDLEFKQSAERSLKHLVDKFHKQAQIDEDPKFIRGVNTPLSGNPPPMVQSQLAKEVAIHDMRTLYLDFNPTNVSELLPTIELILSKGVDLGCKLSITDEVALRTKHLWFRWFIRNFCVIADLSMLGGVGLPTTLASVAVDEHDEIDLTNSDGFKVSRESHTTARQGGQKPCSVSLRNNVAKAVMYAKHIPTAVGGADTEVKPVNTLGPVECREIIAEPLATADPDFLNIARFFLNPVAVTWYLAAIKELPIEPLVSLEQSSYDCFKMLVEEFTTIHESDFVLTNQEALNHLETKFGSGLFDLTRFDNLNQRGHPKKNQQVAWSMLAVAPGVTYFKNSLMQSLACLQTRYLTKSMAVMFTYESQKFAYDIADLFYFEHMVNNFDIFNEQDIWMTTMESERSMKIKNYESQVKYAMGGDTDVRFNMKDIFKPFKTKIDLFKAGQGISAWSKDTQTLFQSAFRVINKHFINSLLPHVVYDNGVDEVTMMNRVNALFSCLPAVCVNGVIDATACDSGQNRFTQRIERRVLERLGLREEFLDLYYSYREEYILKGYGVTARISDIKTSGEPATLLNNTILMAALMNYLVRGQGPCVLVIKGDDGLKRQANIVYDERLKNTMKKYLKMDFKVDIDVPITFCGYFLYERYLVPDLVRKVFKILGHKFVDFEHFQEYQESLRDWVLNANKLGVSDICYISANSYNLTPDYCYQLFHAIVSLTHINRDQFEKVFVKRCFDWDQPYPVSEKWSEKAEWYSGPN